MAGCCGSSGKKQPPPGTAPVQPGGAGRAKAGPAAGGRGARAAADDHAARTQDEKPEPHWKTDALLWPEDRATGRGGSPESKRLKGRKVIEYRVLLTGLHNAGKSHMLWTLIQGSAAEPATTDDFREEKVYVAKGNSSPKAGRPRVNFLMVDLGGQRHVREKYLRDAALGCDAVMFMVDAADPSTFDEAGGWLARVASHLGAPPVLLLAHKSDAAGARPADDVAGAVGLADRAGAGGAATMAVATSLSSEGQDEAMRGMLWLADCLQQQSPKRAQRPAAGPSF